MNNTAVLEYEHTYNIVIPKLCSCNVFNVLVHATLVCGSDQIESLSYFGHCAHSAFRY